MGTEAHTVLSGQPDGVLVVVLAAGYHVVEHQDVVTCGVADREPVLTAFALVHMLAEEICGLVGVFSKDRVCDFGRNELKKSHGFIIVVRLVFIFAADHELD